MGGNSPTTVCDRKLKSVGYHVAFFCVYNLTFSRFGTVQARVRQTDTR